MRIICTLAVLFQAAVICSFAQNVGIGTTEPYNKLQVQGSLLVTTPTINTNTAPTVAQTKTLPGLGTISYLNTDSTGRLYDPGGPGGNYGIDLDSKVNIPFSSNIAIEVTAETMDLNTGDSLIIKESSTGTTLLAVGNGYNTTGKWVFNSSSLYINFKSNIDFNTGAGFSLFFKRLYSNSGSLPGINGYGGNTFFFDAKNGALRSGRLVNETVGHFSVSTGLGTIASGLASTAMGIGTTASGLASTAMGDVTTASGDYSTSTGFNTSAIGDYSTAMGRQTSAGSLYTTAMGYFTGARGLASTAMGYFSSASGNYSTAMGKYTDATGYAATAVGDSSLASGAMSFSSGFRTTASGDYSTAMGLSTIASGNYSTAIGSYVNTNNQEGTLVIGDHSTASTLNSNLSNFFYARFAGGYAFYTSSNLSSVCILAPGANAWSTSSDVRLKENFETVNGENFLQKIAALKLTSWNYKKQGAATFRHYGPMAQDFYAAFGKDKYGTIGNDTTINSADFDGVNLIAIQALVKRTQKLEVFEKKSELLANENKELMQMLLELRKEVNELKRQLQKINEPLQTK
jgi:Chaperone of endosialidase/Head domain of trimeric autotransporter adhesin